MALATSISIGQSLAVLNGVDKIEGHKSNGDDYFTVGMDIQNNGTAPISVMAKRIVLSEVSGSINYFCWTACYGPNTNVSAASTVIQPGDTTGIFKGYYRPYDNAGSTIIRYVFFDENNPDDSTYYDVEYKAWGGLGGDGEDDDVIINEPYPNPAIDQTIFEFELPNSSGRYTLDVYDLLGNHVKELPLNPSEKRVVLNVSDMRPGVYFYAVSLEGNALITRKLIVSRN